MFWKYTGGHKIPLRTLHFLVHGFKGGSQDVLLAELLDGKWLVDGAKSFLEIFPKQASLL